MHHKVSPQPSLHTTTNTGERVVKPQRSNHVVQASLLHTPPLSSDSTTPHESQVSADNNLKQVDRYPPTELEWLATSAFNHGVDYYVQENDKECKKWAEQAFVLAQWLEDDGALRDLLMEKCASLKLRT
jgi:hypothetical protein